MEQLIFAHICQPVGAEFDTEITVDAHGNPMADGGVYATSRDLDRFGAPYLGGGVVPRVWIADTARGASDGADAFVAGDNPPDRPPGAHYRNCWWVRDPAAPFLTATGTYGQNVYVLPAAELLIAKLSAWPPPLHQPTRLLTLDAVHAIAAALREAG
jgi:CubicO group peptidase (beta-lactamase class C family)